MIAENIYFYILLFLMYYIPLQIVSTLVYSMINNFKFDNILYWLTDPLLNVILISLIISFILIG
jgi:hypothetical protein